MKRKKFSERIGLNQPKSKIQLNSIDKDLRNSLWNILLLYLISPLRNKVYYSESTLSGLVDQIWFSYFKEPLDKIPPRTQFISDELRNRFFDWDYLNVYDFLDFLSTKDEFINIQKFCEDCNYVLELELSGYRFVNYELAPITNDSEIESIESAISSSEEKGFTGVRIHLKSALQKLSDRQNPDYRNSIKESISAVESICQQITGDNNAELGKALKKIKNHFPIHGALETGFIKLYGYTSNDDGIRHALLDEDNLKQEDALYMLVSCSAFINYLLTKLSRISQN